MDFSVPWQNAWWSWLNILEALKHHLFFGAFFNVQKWQSPRQNCTSMSLSPFECQFSLIVTCCPPVHLVWWTSKKQEAPRISPNLYFVLPFIISNM
jgi:hypothetical protein